jgi:uncharacterized membrane protein
MPLRWTLVGTLLLAAQVAANLSLDVIADDRRVIDLGVFGFEKGGVFQFTVDHFFIDDPDATMINGHERFHHNESVGFALLQVDSAQEARYIRNYAVSEGQERRVCLDQDDLAPKDSSGYVLPRYFFYLSNKTFAEIQARHDEITIDRAGLYALFFFNCWGFSTPGTIKPIAVSFNADATEYNVGSGGAKNYLSAGLAPLPILFTQFTFVFAGLTALWVREMKRNVQYVQHIHRIMLFLLIVKTLSLLFEALKFAHYASTGHGGVWDFFYYLFLTIKGISLFGVVILLGSGWSFMKAMLSEQDKRLLMIVLPAQVLVNICLAVVEETNEGSRGWGSWSDILRIVDVVCCCAVLLPIVWSINNLRTASENDEKAAQTLSRMRLFRTFYIVVVAYIYFTRIILVLIAVAFYVYSGYQFRPMKENPYLRLSRDDREELELRAEVGDQAA